MKVVMIQLDSVWEDPTANFAKVDALLAANPPEPGSLLVLPEMFSTGFSLDLAKTRQTMARETEEYLRRLAMRCKSAVIGGGVSAGAAGKGRNESVVFSATGRLLARYVKQRPFTAGGEDRVHEAGREPVVFPLEGFNVALLVCYDLRFPELFRAAARLRADLFVVIAAWPVKRIDHWVTLLRARAIENQAFVVGVNRVGSDPRFVYTGRSLVVNPHGEIVADAGESETVFTANIEHADVVSWRAEFPALRDARL
jgi:omega-amidase